MLSLIGGSRVSPLSFSSALRGASPRERKRMCECAENKEQQLNEIFERIGEENGMRASAEFAAFTDLKVKWVRTSDWAEFRVSDYLRDAPEGGIEDLARTIMAKIRGCGGDYTERATAWLTALEFSEVHRPVYLERDERAGGAEGEHKSIEASLGRLEGLGLIERDPSIDIRWSREEERGNAARSSVLMRLIVVDRALDSDDVPDSALDLAVLKHLSLIKAGFLAEPLRRDREVEDALSRYPGFDGTIEWMEDHGLAL